MLEKGQEKEKTVGKGKDLGRMPVRRLSVSSRLMRRRWGCNFLVFVLLVVGLLRLPAKQDAALQEAYLKQDNLPT